MKKLSEDLRHAANNSQIDELERQERERQGKLVQENLDSWNAWQKKIKGNSPVEKA
jgi:hypothetical protein